MKNLKALFGLLIVGIIFLSGCINVDIYQKIKRSGKYDLNLTVSTEEQYAIFLNGLKKDLEVSDEFKNQYSYSETADSVTYSFTDLDPNVEPKLFKDIEEQADTTNTFNEFYASLPQTADLKTLQPKNIEFTKSFSFPYYVYNYKFSILPPEKTEVSAKDHILDEAGLLTEEDQSKIAEVVQNIYDNDKVELIVATRAGIDKDSHFDEIDDITTNFNYQDLDRKHIIVYVNHGDGYFCRVDSNLYFDFAVTEKLSEMTDNLIGVCKEDNIDEHIVNTVEELDKYLADHQLSDFGTSSPEQIGDLFQIGYTVDVFGEVTDTNGKKMENNQVKFNINSVEGGSYELTFRDFFLASILGDSWLTILIVIGVIILLLIVGGGAMMIAGRKNKQKKLEEQAMDSLSKPVMVGGNEPAAEKTDVKNELEDITRKIEGMGDDK